MTISPLVNAGQMAGQPVEGSVGRPAVGVDIGGTKVLIGVISPYGDIRHISSFPSSEFAGSADAVALLGAWTRDTLAQAGLGPSDVAGGGIGVPGVIDPADGTVLSCPNLHALEGMSLAQGLSEATGLRWAVDNDVNLAALAEHWLFMPQVKHMAFIALGTGVGLGLIIDGSVYRGTGAAGEFGHIVLDPNGPLCGCGNHGCLETLCSGHAISQAYSRVLDGLVPTVDVFARMRSGDELAASVVYESLDYLGLAVANLVNILSPEVVVIGGGWGTAQYDIIEPRLKKGLELYGRLVARDRVKILQARSGPQAGLIGAARLAML